MKCGLCGIDKPRECFSPDRRQRTGLQRWCKPCRSAKQKQYDAPMRAAMQAQAEALRAERLKATEKTCSGCGETKPLADFPVCKAMVLGRDSRCRECKRAGCRKTHERHREKYQAKQRERYYLEIEEQRAAARQWYEANKSDPELRARRLIRSREHSAKQRAEQPEFVNARKRAWCKANPEKMRIQWARKRMRELAVTSDLTETQWLEILEVHDHRCAYCLRKLTRPTKDHVIAVTRGGYDTASNIVPACQSCNSRKHNRPVFAMVNTPIQFDAVA